MYDKELAVHILEKILKSSETIRTRFEAIQCVEDFTSTPGGMEKFDSICMILITIGESLKKLDKLTEGQLLPEYPEIEWKKVKGPRDIITHQYFDVNVDAIYNVCDEKLPKLRNTVSAILGDIKDDS